jgi:stringent starvation protein B
MEERHPKEVVETLLAQGDTMLCVDSRHPDVHVPDSHSGKADLRLVLNLGFRHAIQVLPEGVQADLMFGGRLHHCWIPYESLWGVYNPDTGEGSVWPDRLPGELGALVDPGSSPEGPKAVAPAPEQPPQESVGDDAGKTRGSGRPKLRVLPGGRGKDPAR